MNSAFGPIAIVGRDTLFPGARGPEALGNLVFEGASRIGPVPEDRWRIDPARVRAGPEGELDRTRSDQGGYVRQFDFDPTGFRLPPETFEGLDPSFHWALATARGALQDIGRAPSGRKAAVMGLLSFPSSELARFSEQVWAGRSPDVDPRNRFMSGLPALLLREALGLDAGAFALDAACASSLYAVKLACDMLHEDRADMVLAGAINRADDLFIHIGFTALDALSPTGQSRPFQAEADGLVPAEGAGFVALCRYEDAIAEKLPIYGVIRGVGLANDGRGRSLLAPSSSGQVRSMRAAFEGSGLTPKDIGFVECHATGTPVGDATELRSLAEVYGSSRKLPIGSVKSNFGHPITAAGIAGLTKVLSSFARDQLPPTRLGGRLNPVLDETGLRVIDEARAFGGPRRAAVSAFGFGGNDAHLLVEAPDAYQPWSAPRTANTARSAVVGLGLSAGSASNTEALSLALDGAPIGPRAEAVQLGLPGLRFPPKSLEESLPQQKAVLACLQDAFSRLELPLEGTRTGVYVGMGCDPEVARWGARWRAGASDPRRDVLAPPLTAAAVVGTMPNMPANRVSSWLDLHGPSFSVSAEQGSGLVALELARAALARGDIDVAIVAAADFSAEAVHTAARARCLESTLEPGDGAAALILLRPEDASARGLSVLAEVGPDEGASVPSPEAALPAAAGEAHAAHALLELGAQILHQARRSRSGRPSPAPAPTRVETTDLMGGKHAVAVHPAGTLAPPGARGLQLHVYEGDHETQLLEQASAGPGAERIDPHHRGLRLVLAASEAERPDLVKAVAEARRTGGPLPERSALGSPIEGELGFLFGAAGAAYPGMGVPLVTRHPRLLERLEKRFSKWGPALGWAFEGRSTLEVSELLWGASGVAQLHAELSLRVLGLRPQAAIGYSSGESNALFAFGAWRDLDRMIEQAADSDLFSQQLTGRFDAVRAAWGEAPSWAVWILRAPIEAIEAAVEDEPRAHISIVHTDDEAVIAGAESACQRVIARLGAARATPLAYPLAVHVPEVEQVQAAWHALHQREVHPVPGVRFYSHAYDAAYEIGREACADAITAQAVKRIDLRRSIEQAYADGVRIFLEHGPRNAASRWIADILGDRPHLAVSLDRRANPLDNLWTTLCKLSAAGVELDASALAEDERPWPAPRRAPILSHPAHAPAVPPETSTMSRSSHPETPMRRVMRPAPALPSALAAEDQPRRWLPGSAGHAPHAEAARPAPQAPMSPVFEAPTVEANLSDAWVQAIAQQQRLLADAHQRFLAQQADVHARFLELRRAGLEMLGSMPAEGQPAAQSAPSIEAAPVRAPAPPARAVPPPPPAPSSPPTPPAPMKTRPVLEAPAPKPAPKHLPPAPKSPGPLAAEAAPPKAKSSARGGTDPRPSPAPERKVPVGPIFDRDGLKVHASGAISEIFGPRFEVQDGFPRQVRMPEPPMLLADRVTGIDAEIGSMSTGTIWTETDVTEDAWYLHEGRMPAGIMIEAGQADLMLVSYLGADFQNRGERIYRLLGCDLTYHAGLPVPGDTLAYEIAIDGHAEQGPIRIFFFHYDGYIAGERRISVRGGQAGFFTDEELADSGGILWKPEDEAPPSGRLDAPRVPGKPSFDEAAVTAFSEGRGLECFGPGYERLGSHTATPRISGGAMVFFDEVETFDPSGGPWQRGYLRARRRIRPDDWFFEGHFKNDPCMPGTLMFEGCLQTMAFYLAALGFTLDKDGWRFEPVPEETYRLRCRGQVTPKSRDLVYEVFVREVQDGDRTVLWADLMCTVDGLKAFHAAKMGLALVPDWPLDRVARKELAAPPFPGARPAAVAGDIRFDIDAMLACAHGRPSRAFGALYDRFDGARKVPRLPGPPYHFISRVVEVPPEAKGAFEPGVEIEVEYDVPPDAWYFEDGASGHMPYAVLLEAALQPCGWLASYIGSTLQVEEDLFFRNLDGTGTLHAPVGPDAGILSTRVRLERVAQSGTMIIVGFTVACRLGDREVYTMDTVFGFFPGKALASQAGLPILDPHRAALEREGEARSPDASWPLSVGRLKLIDTVEGWWPGAGTAELGAVRCSMRVDPEAWFFRAHFFQDPVQPGSLGVEAMLDSLRIAACSDLGEARAQGGHFELLAPDVELGWKYRGQVLPESKKVQVTLELTERLELEGGIRYVADGSLWVDGRRIYEARGLSLVFRDQPLPPGSREQEPTSTPWALEVGPETAWVGDHRPTWTLPAIPMMSLLDAMVHALPPGRASLRDVRLKGWVLADRPRRLTPTVEDGVVRLLDESGQALLEGRISDKASPDAPAWPEVEAQPDPLPYEDQRLFHGPAFRALTRSESWAGGARGTVDRDAIVAGAPEVPRGRIDPLLLDAGTHLVPHDELERWNPMFEPGKVAYPARVDRFELLREPPRSSEVEVRLLESEPDFPRLEFRWSDEAGIWARCVLTEWRFPKGRIGSAPPSARAAFLQGKDGTGISLARTEGDETLLSTAELRGSNWLPGTVKCIYGTESAKAIAVAEHRAQRHGLHPRNIHRRLPYTRDPVTVSEGPTGVRVTSSGPSQLDLGLAQSFWRTWFQRERWPVEDVYFGLIERFVGRVVVEDPDGLDAIRGRAALFLSNHQTMVESLLFSILAAPLIEVPTLTLAKAEHRDTWLGHLIATCFAYPGITDPEVMKFFDRDDRASLPAIIAELATGLASREKAVMVHVEGTRALEAVHHVEKMSGAFIDLALETGAPVVPIRFTGGLPREPLEERVDFPIGMGKQDVFIGAPLEPEVLRALPYGPRKALVLEAIESLGGPRGAEHPHPGQPGFAAAVKARVEAGAPEASAVLSETLAQRSNTTDEAARLVAAATSGSPLELGEGPREAWLGQLARLFHLPRSR